MNTARPLARGAAGRVRSGRRRRAPGTVISHNPSFLERTAGVAGTARPGGQALAAAALWLGPEAREQLALLDRDYDEFRRAGRERDQRPLDREERFRELPGVNERAEALLAAYDRLDAALVAEGDKWQGSSTVSDGIGWFVNLALSALGVAAVVTVAGLTRREQRARAAAESAVRTRDEVVSIVSHDLRNPLSTVQMAAAYLLDSLPAEAVRASDRKSLEMIKRAAEGMARMIQDLLDIARIESGNLAVERAAFPWRRSWTRWRRCCGPWPRSSGSAWT